MDQETVITDPSQVLVADRVKFSYHGRELTGTVAKKGKTFALIVGDDQQEFRVPYQQLYKISGAVTPYVHTVNDHRRAAFHAGDKVRFDFRGAVRHGVVVRLNATRAHVISEDGREYRVPYMLLSSVGDNHASPASPHRERDLDTVAKLARDLIARHQLSQWSFQFDNGTKRAGCCHYAIQRLSLSYEFAKRASDEEIADTLLHEIAHALVGKDHHHDEVWRAKALEIGCSGRRCHDLQFTPPRYIVTCETRCWVATAERKRRGVVCKHCQGKLVYLTYTEERWNSEYPKVRK